MMLTLRTLPILVSFAKTVLCVSAEASTPSDTRTVLPTLKQLYNPTPITQPIVEPLAPLYPIVPDRSPIFVTYTNSDYYNMTRCWEDEKYVKGAQNAYIGAGSQYLKALPYDSICESTTFNVGRVACDLGGAIMWAKTSDRDVYIPCKMLAELADYCLDKCWAEKLPKGTTHRFFCEVVDEKNKFRVVTGFEDYNGNDFSALIFENEYKNQ